MERLCDEVDRNLGHVQSQRFFEIKPRTGQCGVATGANLGVASSDLETESRFSKRGGRERLFGNAASSSSCSPPPTVEKLWSPFGAGATTSQTLPDARGVRPKSA